MQLLRCLSKAQRLGYSNEIAEVTQFHTALSRQKVSKNEEGPFHHRATEYTEKTYY